MLQLLKNNPRPGGIFCYNDPVAASSHQSRARAWYARAGVSRYHQRRQHCTIPISYALPLSGIDQSSALIGERAAGVLSEDMESKSRCRTRASSSLRGSCCTESSNRQKHSTSRAEAENKAPGIAQPARPRPPFGGCLPQPTSAVLKAVHRRRNQEKNRRTPAQRAAAAQGTHSAAPQAALRSASR